MTAEPEITGASPPLRSVTSGCELATGTCVLAPSPVLPARSTARTVMVLLPAETGRRSAVSELLVQIMRGSSQLHALLHGFHEVCPLHACGQSGWKPAPESISMYATPSHGVGFCGSPKSSCGESVAPFARNT